MSSYRKGRAFEYLVLHHFATRGKMVIRSAGSHSPADLMVVGDGEVLFVQCKSNRSGRYSWVIPSELKELADLARAKAKIICKIPGYTYMVHTITYDPASKETTSQEEFLEEES